jgi:hypothetical protein
MSIDTKNNTITVDDVKYDVHREPDRGHPEETLTIRDYDPEADDWIFPFPGLEATLGYEEHDTSYANPRQWSNVGVMAAYHSHYHLGDEDVDPRDFLDNEKTCDQCEGDGVYPPYGHDQFKPVEGTPSLNMPDDDHPKCEKCDGAGVIPIKLADWIRQEYGARVIIPLFLYDHSGISMSAGDAIIARPDEVGDFAHQHRHPFDAHGWDVSSVGVIFDTLSGVEECMGKDATLEDIEKALRAEVEIYSSYLEGDVMLYAVTDEETGYNDSCGGFVGDSDHCEQQCFESLEYAIKKRLAENAEREHWRDRGVETE